MGTFKKSLVAILASAAALCCTLALLLCGDFARANVLTLESAGAARAVSLTETGYGKDDGFVFSAVISLERGNEGGLVFGADGAGSYWAFGFDRTQNSLKLAHVSQSGAETYKQDYFIGNNKMTEGESNIVGQRVAAISKVQLKVVITPEEEGVFAEFYADNIRRFAFDEKGEEIRTDLDALSGNLSYAGGNIGYYCNNAKIAVNEAYYGVSDFSYYTELYRQQYHYSQYAHWNNDPNGLVYYNGYYHIYYQHNPYGETWGDMYWGHARSTDMVHWENLPVCLFPDDASDPWGDKIGYMWSGSAMVYRAGTSADIDGLNWFENGEGTGLIGFYTRQTAGRQDQMIMSSDDGGITWTKRKLISQNIILDAVPAEGGLEDCRDPKVFKLENYGWGMVVTGMHSNNVWFLKSQNLLDWSFAGGFKAELPECPDLFTLTADGDTYAVMTFTSRRYIVGNVRYDGESGKIIFTDCNGRDVSGLALNEIPFKTMDYGPDSYASQTFFIDDEASEFYGKTIITNWFSGVPGAELSVDSGTLASARKVWNGGGFTIPAELGLVKEADGSITLTQTPIVKTAEGFKTLKTQAYSGSNEQIDATSENILKDVKGNRFELEATVQNPDGAHVYFRINTGDGEYTEIGWSKANGYYLDRSHTGDAGLNLSNYRNLFKSNKGEAGEQTFYILSDNGSVEVFCGGFTVPFYAVTFPSPYSDGMSFSADGEVSVDITVNKISSVWRDGGDNFITVDEASVTLDTLLTTQKQIFAYAPDGGELSYRIVKGEGVIEIEELERGAVIKSLAAGSAEIEISSGEAVRTIPVTVTAGYPETEFTFKPEGVTAGSWYTAEGTLKGVQLSGDGFIFAEEEGSDFVLSSHFILGGAAAALVFRANEALNNYLVLTYDINAPVVKLWSPSIAGNLGEKTVEKTNDISLTVIAKGTYISVFFNGEFAFDCNRGDIPLSGRFGLNVCAGNAEFTSVTARLSYGGGDFKVAAPAYATGIFNRTAGNAEVNRAFYKYENSSITISEEYFKTLKNTGEYLFTVNGGNYSYDFKLNVSALPSAELKDITVEAGNNAVIFVGNLSAGGVTLNGAELSADGYKIRDGVLTVYADWLAEGENVIGFAGKTFTVTVTARELKEVAGEPQEVNLALAISLPIAGAAVIGAAAAVTVILLRRRKAVKADKTEEKKDGDDDKGRS